MRYHNITKDDMLNGDGLRVVLWLSGCDHKCEGCQNPITWDPMDGLVFDDLAKQELFDELEKDYISGITFSGGDPLYINNYEETGRLIEEIRSRYPHKTIWLYTGYTYEQVLEHPFKTYLNNIDVLVDGRFVKELFDPQLHWKGSSNQRVIDIQESLILGRVVLHHT